MICCNNFSRFLKKEQYHLCAFQVGSDFWLSWVFVILHVLQFGSFAIRATTLCFSLACFRSAFLQEEKLGVLLAESHLPLIPRQEGSSIGPSVNGCNHSGKESPGSLFLPCCRDDCDMVLGSTVKCDSVFDQGLCLRLANMSKSLMSTVAFSCVYGLLGFYAPWRRSWNFLLE